MQCQDPYKAELQRFRWTFLQAQPSPFWLQDAPRCTYWVALKPVLSSLYSPWTPSGTGFTMLLLWDPGLAILGITAQAPQFYQSAALDVQPRPPSHQFRKYTESHSQAGQESGRITLINMDIIFQAPCQGWIGTATVAEAAWNPSPDSGFLRTLTKQILAHPWPSLSTFFCLSLTVVLKFSFILESPGQV